MYVQITVRDGDIQASRDRVVENKINLIDAPYIHNDHIEDKFILTCFFIIITRVFIFMNSVILLYIVIAHMQRGVNGTNYINETNKN